MSDLYSLYPHPLILNPHPNFWLVVICYAFLTIVLKLVFQAHVICMCNNEFR